VLGPAVAKEDLGGAAAWGAILTCETVGLMLGGLLMLRYRPQRMLFVATLCMFLAAVPSFLLGIPAHVAAIAAGALVMGAGLEVFGVLWDTSMQQEIPGEKLSRVYSYDMVGSFVLIPVATAAVGPISEAIGSKAVLWGASLLVVAATLPVLAVPDVRRLRRRA
jgi:predicted MFS family arabinose efflux permease